MPLLLSDSAALKHIGLLSAFHKYCMKPLPPFPPFLSGTESLLGSYTFNQLIPFTPPLLSTGTAYRKENPLLFSEGKKHN